MLRESAPACTGGNPGSEAAAGGAAAGAQAQKRPRLALLVAARTRHREPRYELAPTAGTKFSREEVGCYSCETTPTAVAGKTAVSPPKARLLPPRCRGPAAATPVPAVAAPAAKPGGNAHASALPLRRARALAPAPGPPPDARRKTPSRFVPRPAAESATAPSSLDPASSHRALHLTCC